MTLAAARPGIRQNANTSRTFTLVQSATDAGFSGARTTRTISFTNPVSVGNIVVATHVFTGGGDNGFSYNSIAMNHAADGYQYGSANYGRMTLDWTIATASVSNVSVTADSTFGGGYGPMYIFEIHPSIPMSGTTLFRTTSGDGQTALHTQAHASGSSHQIGPIDSMPANSLDLYLASFSSGGSFNTSQHQYYQYNSSIDSHDYVLWMNFGATTDATAIPNTLFTYVYWSLG